MAWTRRDGLPIHRHDISRKLVQVSTRGLERFFAAQDPVWPRVVAELQEGAKRSHWMWFLFPQIESIGQSPMSFRYAIATLDEARACARRSSSCLRTWAGRPPRSSAASTR
jgi:hypothetical protein